MDRVTLSRNACSWGQTEERLTIWQLYPICAASEKSGSESERVEGKIKMGKFLGGSDAEKAYCR
jgi:hypothetical protein